MPPPFRGEEARVRVRDTIDLRVHRREHLRMGMAEARHRGPSAGVEVAPAVGGDDLHSASARRERRNTPETAVKNVCH